MTATTEELVELEDIVAQMKAIRETRAGRAEQERANAAALIEAVSGTDNLPAGTYVWFTTKAGWYENDSRHGAITRVTEKSYITSDGSRITREGCSEYYRGRRLAVVRTPADQAVWEAERAELDRLQGRGDELRKLERERRFAAERAEQDAVKLQRRQATREATAERKALQDLVLLHPEAFRNLFAGYLAEEPLPQESDPFSFRVITTE